MKERQLREGWLLLCAGLFLWNPVIGVRDVLPDAIGYLLLCLGVSRMADLNDEIACAQRSFRAMLWVGLGEIVAGLLVNVFLTQTGEVLNRYEQPVWALVFSFAFLVFEWYFMLPGWKHFFKGLSQLAEFHGGSLILAEKKERTLCERLGRFSAVFVIVRTLCTVLPEMTVLTSFEHDAENPAFTVDLFSFVGLFRAVAVAIAFVIGFCWLIRYLRFVRLGMKDAEWKEALTACYRAEILPRVGMRLNRRVGTAFAFFRVGAVFCVNLALLYHEVLPDWVAVPLILCGWLFLGKLLEASPLCAISGVALMAVGIYRSVRNDFYLREYIPADALHLPEAYALYQPVRIAAIAEAILCLLFFLLLLSELWKMAQKHLYTVSGSGDLLSEHTAERQKRELRNKLIPASVFLILSAFWKISEALYQQTYGWIWLVQFAFSFTAVILFSGCLSAIAEQIADRDSATRE